MSSLLPISGYVLAGGLSSRMRRDKVLLPLAGKALIEHAVAKLRRICAEVAILGSNPELAAYAQLVPDLHPGCGPIGGIEAALAHTARDWNLILPVDLPFVPTEFLRRWAAACCSNSSGAKLALFAVEAMPQPTLLMIHRDLAPYLTRAIQRGEYQLYRALESAAQAIARESGRRVDQILHSQPCPQPEWLTNLNTPEDFAAAQARPASDRLV